MERTVVARLAAGLAVVIALSTPSAVRAAAPQVPDASPALETSGAARVVAPGVPTQWASVSAAGDTTCGIDGTQKLYCWGANGNGQVGDGTNVDRTLPVQIGTADWLSVRTSYYTSCGIQADRSAWCWGSNSLGQLGNGENGGENGGDETDADANTPQRVLGDQEWAAFSAGFYNSCGISTAGALYCTGFDGTGSLGDGPGDSTTDTLVRIGSSTSWDAVTVGYYHTCARRTTGRTFCWGDGEFGATGTGDRRNTYSPAALPGAWKSINTVAVTTCGVTSKAVAKCWGLNRRGQVGNGTTSATPVYRPTRLAIGATSTFTRVRPGLEYTCGTTAARGVRCFGSNAVGQFGDGSTTSRLVPVPGAGRKTGWTLLSFGDRHACGIRNAGKLLCWGAGDHGQLGNGATAGATSPAQVGALVTPGPGAATGPGGGSADDSAGRGPRALKP